MVNAQEAARSPRVTMRKNGRHFSNHPAAAKLPRPRTTATNGPMQHKDEARAEIIPPARIHDCFTGFMRPVYTLYYGIRSTPRKSDDYRRTRKTGRCECANDPLLRTSKALSSYSSMA